MTVSEETTAVSSKFPSEQAEQARSSHFNQAVRVIAGFDICDELVLLIFQFPIRVLIRADDVFAQRVDALLQIVDSAHLFNVYCMTLRQHQTLGFSETP